MILHKIEASKPAFGGKPTLRVVLSGQQQGVPPLIAAQAKEGDYLAVLTPDEVAAIEADRLDAARYRALRELHRNDSDYAVARTTGIKLGVDCSYGERLDEIIDTIRKGVA